MRLPLLCLCFWIASCAYTEKPEITYVVESFTAKEEPFSFKRRFIGTIASEYFSLLKPQMNGTIDEINVTPEQSVKKGQHLFSLDNAAQRSLVKLDEKHLLLAQKTLKRYQTLRKTEDISKAQLETAQLSVLQSEQKLAENKKALKNTEVRAPFDGIVGVPRVVLGQSVTPADTLISIRKGFFSVSFRIPASRLKEIEVGQAVEVNKEIATISAVERSIDPTTRTGFAKVILKDCSRCIVGSSVFAEVTITKKPQAILVPKDAVFYSRGKAHVVMLKTNEQGELVGEEKEVSVGHEQAGMLEIISGLVSGDKVVKANPKRLPKGAKLRVAQ